MAHVEDCKFFLRGACVNGPQCGFRHNEAACHTERLCNRWAAGYTCDGRCNLRHPSAAEIAALAASPPPPTPVVRASPLRQQQALATSHSKIKRQQTATAAAAAPFESATPVCRFHARGRCAKGDACPFFHTPSAAQAAPTPTPLVAEETSARRSRPAPTTLRGAAEAARKQQQQQQRKPFGRPVGGNGTQDEGWTAVVGRGRGATTVMSGRAAANNGGDSGVSTEADAAAKARAADILQKHRLTASAPAVEAGSRGGMRVRRGPPTQPEGKKTCTASPAQRQLLPSTTATDPQGSSIAAPAPGAAAAAPVVPSAAPAVVAVAPREPTTRDESKLPAESGKQGDGDDGNKKGGGGGLAGVESSNGATKVNAVAGTEEAPSCDGAVVHAHSDQQQQHQQQQQQQQPEQEQEQHKRTVQPAAKVS